MKTCLTILLTVLGFGFAHAAPAPLTLAVFDFQSPEEGIRELGPKVSALVGANLSTDSRLLTVERAELDKALSEMELGLSGTVAAESAAKVGHLTGAKVLVTGRVMKSERETIVVAKIIGTETGRVFGAKVVLPAAGSLDAAATELAKSIADTTAKNADELVAKLVKAEDVGAALKAGLKDGKRPAVAVHIPEQHFGQPVIDPAAQTELLLLLKQCGFTLVDEKSTTHPDYTIEGEAFSERGLQKGGLVVCKARVEVKIRRIANGEIVFADSQVSRAVDLSEHIAAKAALQNAARELAQRVIPKIAE